MGEDRWLLLVDAPTVSWSGELAPSAPDLADRVRSTFLGAGRLGQGPRRVRCPLAQDRVADGHREGRGARLRRVPAGALARDLVDQPHRADQRGDRAPSSASSERSCSTCTTNGSQPNAATYPRDPWQSSTPPAIMNSSPPSTAAHRHRGSTSKTHHSAGLCHGCRAAFLGVRGCVSCHHSSTRT